jgi:hypothetical protein
VEGLQVSNQDYNTALMLILTHRVAFRLAAKSSVRRAVRRRVNMYKIYIRTLDRKSPGFAAFIQAQAWVCRAQAFVKACEVGDE